MSKAKKAKRPRISKRVRDEAEMICAIAASNVDLSNWYEVIVRDGLNVDETSYLLALRAWGECTYASLRVIDAHAAALLAEGWCPGDPVEVLP